MTASAIIQVDWRSVLSELWARDVVAAYRTKKDIVRFKIGEGGFTGSPKVPITPDENFIDIQSEGAPFAGGGTVEFTNGSTAVTGVGTSFLADVAVNDWIKPGPEPAVSTDPFSAGEPGTEEDGWGQVQTVTDNSNIVLTGNYIGATHLQSETRPGHKASTPLFTFRKTLTAADVLDESANPAITRVTCTVALAEANTTQLAVGPEFFELSLFDENGVMVCYHTFDQEDKIPSISLVHVLDTVW